MHLDGLIRRDRQPLRVLHIAELLVEAMRNKADGQFVPQVSGVRRQDSEVAERH
jgi:hypothetical protein